MNAVLLDVDESGVLASGRARARSIQRLRFGID
jgi:hypothetical protein